MANLDPKLTDTAEAEALRLARKERTTAPAVTQPDYRDGLVYNPSTDAPQKRIIYRLGDLVDTLATEADAQYQALKDNKPLGLITNIPRLDKELGGALTPGLHSLQGGPGVGKTAFALQVACDCGGEGIYVSCEMHPTELLRRVIARTCNIYRNRLSDGSYTGEEIREFAQQAAAYAPGLVIVDATAGFVPAFVDDKKDDKKPKQMNIYDLAERLGSQSGARCLVVIDSLHSWVNGINSTTEYDRLSAGLDALKALASSLRAPVLAVAERNRASMTAGGMNGGAGHRQIEYSAETVIELDRETEGKDTAARPDARGNYATICKLSKNRNGEVNRPIRLLFNGALQKFVSGDE